MKARHNISFCILGPALLLSSALLATSCSKKDPDKIAEAQDCLDKASANEAPACVEKISGLESEAAYSIRCSAALIYQGLTDPTRLVDIAKQMQSSGGNSTAAIGLLSFSKPDIDTAVTLANQALEDCGKAGSAGRVLLASMASMATAINKAGIGAVVTACDPAAANYDSANCQQAVSNAVCSADSSTLGQAAQAAYTQGCQGSAQENSSVCAQYAAALAAGTTSDEVGAQLKDDLKGSGSCPP